MLHLRENYLLSCGSKDPAIGDVSSSTDVRFACRVVGNLGAPLDLRSRSTQRAVDSTEDDERETRSPLISDYPLVEDLVVESEKTRQMILLSEKVEV